MKAQNDAVLPDGVELKPCSIKRLPDRLKKDGDDAASHVQTAGHPVPEKLTVNNLKRWDARSRTFSVSFLDNAPQELQDRIIGHMNAWTKTCCISFKRAEDKNGQVRISFGPGGYWSYIGTDIMLIPAGEPTMNLEGFTMATSEDEYRRVVRHETGHTLGFEHEHMRKELVNRIDPDKAYTYFLADQGWDKNTVDQQVLTPLDQDSILGTPADETSIMCYQLPGKIMINGIGIPGGKDINPTDYAFAGTLYPIHQANFVEKVLATAASSNGTHQGWHKSKDVKFTPALLERFNKATLSL